MKKLSSTVCIAFLSASMCLSGCTSKASSKAASADPQRSAASIPAAAPPPRRAPGSDAEYGVIESINPTKTGMNAGTAIGGVIGGLLGHQLGGGSGQTATTIAGAVGGAVVGTKVGNRNQVYRISVKLRDGELVTVDQKADVADLKVGERVRVVADHVYPA